MIFDSFFEEMEKISNLNRALRLKKALAKDPGNPALRKSYETALEAHKRRTERFGVDAKRRATKTYDFSKHMSRGMAGRGVGIALGSPLIATGGMSFNEVNQLFGRAGHIIGDASYWAPFAAQKIRRTSAARRYARSVGAKGARDPKLLEKAKDYSKRRAVQEEARRADKAMRRAADKEVEDFLSPVRRYKEKMRKSRERRMVPQSLALAKTGNM